MSAAVGSAASAGVEPSSGTRIFSSVIATSLFDAVLARNEWGNRGAPETPVPAGGWPPRARDVWGIAAPLSRRRPAPRGRHRADRPSPRGFPPARPHRLHGNGHLAGSAEPGLPDHPDQ